MNLLIQKKINKSINIYTYTAPVTVNKPTVSYYVDGEKTLETTKLPYTFNFDINKYEIGEHKVEVKVLSGSKLIDYKSINLTVNKDE